MDDALLRELALGRIPDLIVGGRALELLPRVQPGTGVRRVSLEGLDRPCGQAVVGAVLGLVMAVSMPHFAPRDELIDEALGGFAHSPPAPPSSIVRR